MEWAAQAEQGPFASLGVFDRLVYDSVDPLLTLAFAAGVTTRIRLATTVMIGPIRSPALLAKEAASLDTISNGRLTLGVAIGARRDDYTVSGSQFRDRGRQLSEQMAEMRDIWEDDKIGPQPTQPGGPPMLIGGLSNDAYARMARYADGYIHGGGPPRAFSRSADIARSAWLDLGRPGLPQLWGMGYFALGDADAVAGYDYLLDYYAFTGPFAERIADGLLRSPQQIVQFIRGYADAGCDHVVLFPTSADINQLRRLEDVVG